MAMTNHPYFFPLLNLGGVSLMLIVNALANIIPINGYTTGELSAKYPNLFVPPGWVFGIWGLIYLLNVVFVVWALLNRQDPIISNLGYWYFVSSLFNAAWILLWHYQRVWLSVVVMVGLLISLVVINIKLEGLATDLFGKVALEVNFGIYLGWISVATVANITAGLVASDWDGFGVGEEIWTAVVLVMVLLLSLFMVLSQGNSWFGLVVIWAVFGIFLNQQHILEVAIPAIITVLGSVLAVGYKVLR